MSDYKLAMLVYFSLQGASLAFLPKWWKLAAVPACLVIPQIVDERSKPGYMSDVVIAMVAIYVCAYLVFVWMTFGITKFVQHYRRRRRQSEPIEIAADAATHGTFPETTDEPISDD